MRLRSLRGRVLLASILWTIGLIFIVSMAFTHLMETYPRAWLIAHVFRADVETCARCGGPMRWVEAAASRKSAARLLAKLGLAPQPPPEHAPTPFGQLGLSFGR